MCKFTKYILKLAPQLIDKVEFKRVSSYMYTEEYMKIVFDLSLKVNMNRINKCIQIMGRNDKETLTCSQILYPIMQIADMIYLNIDIAQLGMDQRKVNMLAIELLGRNSPVMIHHKMFSSLRFNTDEAFGISNIQKSSKSDPLSAIFMNDTRESIETKIMSAFCGENPVNPITEILREVVFKFYEHMVVDGYYVVYDNVHEMYTFLDRKSFKLEVIENLISLIHSENYH